MRDTRLAIPYPTETHPGVPLPGQLGLPDGRGSKIKPDVPLENDETEFVLCIIPPISPFEPAVAKQMRRVINELDDLALSIQSNEGFDAEQMALVLGQIYFRMAQRAEIMADLDEAFGV